MGNKQSWQLILLYLVMVLVLIPQIGCAVGKFGKANVDGFDIQSSSELKGQSKSAIVQSLGNPDYVLVDGKTEYWGYRNHNGWYLYLYYVSFGKTEAKDLILEFQDENVTEAYCVDKGSSIGILAAPLSVAN